MLPEGFVAKKDAVNDVTFSKMVFGSVDAAINKRYKPALGRQVAEDPDDFGNQGKKHRVKKDKAERASKTVHGRQAQTIFLQAYQLILWKQCHILVHDHGFPEQFEGVVRDLWALRLRRYSLRINQLTDNYDDGDGPELFSSQASLSEDSSDGASLKADSRLVVWPRILDTVATCYLAAILMRLPVCVSDFHRLIILQDIPYIRALRNVPRDMKERLPPEFIEILEVNKLPQIEHLHRGFRDLLIYYQRQFDIALPALNSPIILYRYIKRLAIPVDVYEVIKTLQGLLGFNFTWPRISNSKTRKKVLDLPDVQMMVLVVIATKILFPFDRLERYPVTSKEPASQAMDWSRWMDSQKHFDSPDPDVCSTGKDKLIQVVDTDVFQMAPNQLDQYMDWYEKSWLNPSEKSNPIANMFPISRAETAAGANSDPASASSTSNDRNPEEALNELLLSVMQDLSPLPVIPNQEEVDCGRPGQWYKRYRWESSLPETARAFYELAAQICGISLKMFVRAVMVAEWRLWHWQEGQRREEYMANEMEYHSDGTEEHLDDEIEDLDEQLDELGMED
ncbi:hypothetical protein N7495_005472 [Penicillium taxi]|uniref:uncharacterized protein n=1 Tax=Penicillium taxi TaxID=168475 RepID=UPI002545269C|nr:uncharacterized protein N7495_005472 [Penicillium taxi]KAJ5893781.1 hypothetical protein N7495_005472 [Penicillium taxi]